MTRGCENVGALEITPEYEQVPYAGQRYGRIHSKADESAVKFPV